MTQTYRSFTYGSGAALGLVFVGVAVYFWLEAFGPLGHGRRHAASLGSAIIIGVVALMVLGVVFAVRRAWVRVSVLGGTVRIQQRLRRPFECALEGMTASVRLVDSAEATPGPRLIRDPKRSAAVRAAVRLILGSHGPGSMLSSSPASEDFARLELRAADGREHVVLLPGVSSFDELEELRAQLPFEREAGPESTAS